MHLRSTSRTRRTAFLTLVVGTAFAALITAAVPTYSINTHRTGRLDNRGFPRHYTADRGLKLQLCEDGTVRCQGATPDALVAPDGEAFYWAATSTLQSRRGPLDVEFALEAAFAGQRPIVFQRIRIRGHLRHKGRYILKHPYGVSKFRAITPREQRNVNFTIDRTCSLQRNRPCHGRIDNFLRARNHPRGYVGFGGRRTRVRGGTFRNTMILIGPKGRVIGRTNKFVIVGQMAGR